MKGWKVSRWLVLGLVVLMLAGCGNSQPTKSQNGTSSAGTQSSTGSVNTAKKITVYFAARDAMHVMSEEHTAAVVDPQTAMGLLMAGPQNRQDLRPVFPQGTKVIGVKVTDKTAFVDFDGSLVKNWTGGSAGELLLVGAVVNTLTEFPEIQKVQFLVNGKKVETIGGHVDVSEPLTRMQDMIKKK